MHNLTRHPVPQSQSWNPLFLRSAIVILAGLFFSGCGTHLDYNRLFTQLQNGQCLLATRQIETSRGQYGSNAELLYLLDAAMVHLQCRDFEAAQEKFHAAERLAENLWTESISRQAASLVTNEYLIKYAGEDYERALINMMSATGYLQSGEHDEALVECRRLDTLLSLFNEKYEEKNVYREDAFGRYLSGTLHEADQALDDAFIDYLKAFNAYQDYEAHYDTPVPPTLVEDLLRMAAAVDRMEEVQALLPDIAERRWRSVADVRPLGKVVFLQFNGRAPAKTQGQVHIPTGHGPLTIAYPRLLLLPTACNHHQLVLDSQAGRMESPLYLVEDIGRIALKNLEDKKARIITKAIARAVVKQVVIDSLSKNSDENVENALKTALNIANLFIEQADTRSWRTLPGEIYMTRLFLPPGDYRVNSVSCDHRPYELENILVQAGKTTYIVHDGRFSPKTSND